MLIESWIYFISSGLDQQDCEEKLTPEDTRKESTIFWSAWSVMALATLTLWDSSESNFNMFATSGPSWLATLTTIHFATHLSNLYSQENLIFRRYQHLILGHPAPYFLIQYRRIGFPSKSTIFSKVPPQDSMTFAEPIFSSRQVMRTSSTPRPLMYFRDC